MQKRLSLPKEGENTNSSLKERLAKKFGITAKPKAEVAETPVNINKAVDFNQSTQPTSDQMTTSLQKAEVKTEVERVTAFDNNVSEQVTPTLGRRELVSKNKDDSRFS